MRMPIAVRFNSLQTGKRFQTQNNVCLESDTSYGFNSLQTGKRFQTRRFYPSIW